MSVPKMILSRPRFALRDHSLAVDVPLLIVTTVAVKEEKCAGGHLAQVEVEDLLPLIHLPLLPRLHLPLLEDVLFVRPLANLVAVIVLVAESLVTVDVSCKRKSDLFSLK